MTTHISLDLETWGTRPGCDIRSIGAVVFDPVHGEVSIPCETCKGGTSFGNIHPFSGDCYDCLNTRMERGYGDTFYIACRNPIQVRFGGPKETEDSVYADMTYRKWYLHRDPETVKWWNDQSAEAKAAFSEPVDLRVALERFTSWIINMYPGGWDGKVTPDIRIWANDPHFDVSILAEAYHAVGLPVPWHYRAPRSMKTATDLAGLTRDEYVTHGTAHNALDDAIAQAWTICKCYERLGLVRLA